MYIAMRRKIAQVYARDMCETIEHGKSAATKIPTIMVMGIKQNARAKCAK